MKSMSDAQPLYTVRLPKTSWKGPRRLSVHLGCGPLVFDLNQESKDAHDFPVKLVPLTPVEIGMLETNGFSVQRSKKAIPQANHNQEPERERE